MGKFSEISAYSDAEVPSVIQRLLGHKKLVYALIAYLYKDSKIVRFFYPLLYHYVCHRYGSIQTVNDFQILVSSFMDKMIAETTAGFSYQVTDGLDLSQPRLYISNHRDITLDPAFLNLSLYKMNVDTVQIAIGDNLLSNSSIADLMRLNKSFIVQRSVVGNRAKLDALKTLSAHIYSLLNSGQSVWLAQQEGRAKDGNDVTDPAILKMLYIHGRSLGYSFADYMRQLNITPVSLSYEFDPNDIAKAKELDTMSKTGSYEKSDNEDIDSILSGIQGYKGQVHLQYCSEISGSDLDHPESLAKAIDMQIYKHYYLYPSNYIADGQMNGISQNYIDSFSQRYAGLSDSEKALVYETYAKPLQNHLFSNCQTSMK